MTGTCVSLWIGPALSAVERACIRSVLRQGHRFVLYRYDDIDGVPDGVEDRDAAEIVPAGRIIRHKGGSVALFTNLFRYELQRRGLGTRLDLDLYLLKPIDMDAPYLMGEEEPGRHTNGVLRLPPDCQILPALLALFEERTVPAWLPWRARHAAHWRLWRTGRAGLSQMSWGSAGPAVLTYLVHLHGIVACAVPPEILYQVHWRDARWVLEPECAVEDRVTGRTSALHLYNELIKGFKDRPAPPGSFLARLQSEGVP